MLGSDDDASGPSTQGDCTLRDLRRPRGKPRPGAARRLRVQLDSGDQRPAQRDHGDLESLRPAGPADQLRPQPRARRRRRPVRERGAREHDREPRRLVPAGHARPDRGAARRGHGGGGRRPSPTRSWPPRGRTCSAATRSTRNRSTTSSTTTAARRATHPRSSSSISYNRARTRPKLSRAGVAER